MTDCIFWQQTLKPGEKIALENEIGESCIEVQSASIFDLNDQDPNSACRVFAYIHCPTEVPDSDTEQNDQKQDKAPIQEEKINKILFASILPSQRETCDISYIICPFDFLELENTSKATITIKGVYQMVDLDSDEEEEQHAEEEEEQKPSKKGKSKKDAEDEDEEIDTNEIVSKVMNHMKKHQKK